jgi:hypothetical protein
VIPRRDVGIPLFTPGVEVTTMDADVVGDLVAPDRQSDVVALRRGGRAGSYTYDTACREAWKAGNLLRQYGVRSGATVAIDADPGSIQPIVAFLGAALLGATVRFDPPGEVTATVLVTPAATAGEYEPGPGTRVLAYGEVPEQSGVAHFEREAWSENPTPPPEDVTPGTVALSDGARRYTHWRLLSLADEVVSGADLGPGDEVALRAPLAHPGALVAGVLAPLSVGATVLLDREATGTVAVATDAAPEPRVVSPVSVVDGHSET